MTRPSGSGSKRPRKGAKKKVQPFIVEAVRGGIAVYRRPVGNLAIPRLCGVMPTRPKAVEFARLLGRAESAAPDLFLEATDDGIEALEAVIAACQSAALGGTGERGARRGRAARAPRAARPHASGGDAPGADGHGTGPGALPSAEAGGAPTKRGAGRRRGRRGRGPRGPATNGGETPPAGGGDGE